MRISDWSSDVCSSDLAVEANVATGYHAIEFLLWGQDLNGTGPGAGNRPASDFSTADCTGGSCERRGKYLKVATELLIDDLQDIVAAWGPGGGGGGSLLSGESRAIGRAPYWYRR